MVQASLMRQHLEKSDALGNVMVELTLQATVRHNLLLNPFEYRLCSANL